jgi:hypothetical protein
MGRKLSKRDRFPGKDRILKLVTTGLLVPTNTFATQADSGYATASRDQIDEQDDQRYHQQQVNQAAGYVKAEAQSP